VSAKKLATMTGNALPVLQEFESVDIMTVNLWYPEPNLVPEGLGYLIPRSVSHDLNPERALGVFFDSQVGLSGPGEPDGTKLFVLMGGHYYDKPGQVIPTEQEAVAQAKALVQRHLGIDASSPCHAMASLAKDCIPQQNVGWMSRLRRLDEQLTREYRGTVAAVGGFISRPGVLGALAEGWRAAQLSPVQYVKLEDIFASDQATRRWSESPMVMEHAPPYHHLLPVSAVDAVRGPRWSWFR
jgi:protoporphyrinogen/coproporphyrinogen III oxidase